jgi:hypothetical protein
MRLPRRIIRSVEAGHGLTGAGTALLAHKLGEPGQVAVVCRLDKSNSPRGIAQRLMAVAFAITRPDSMIPSPRENSSEPKA